MAHDMTGRGSVTSDVGSALSSSLLWCTEMRSGRSKSKSDSRTREDEVESGCRLRAARLRTSHLMDPGTRLHGLSQAHCPLHHSAPCSPLHGTAASTVTVHRPLHACTQPDPARHEHPPSHATHTPEYPAAQSSPSLTHSSLWLDFFVFLHAHTHAQPSITLTHTPLSDSATLPCTHRSHLRKPFRPITHSLTTHTYPPSLTSCSNNNNTPTHHHTPNTHCTHK